jgi:hypothetical protein
VTEHPRAMSPIGDAIYLLVTFGLTFSIEASGDPDVEERRREYMEESAISEIWSLGRQVLRLRSSQWCLGESLLIRSGVQRQPQRFRRVVF